MVKRELTKNLLALACLSLPMVAARAQANIPDDAATQGVEVKGIKNPALMPYRRAYDLVSGVEQAGGSRVKLLIRVTSTESHQAIPGLTLRVVGENTDANVPLTPDGHVDLPLDKAFYADKADIVANKPSKSLNVDIHVEPQLGPGEIRFADLMEVTSAGQAAISRIVPWYVRAIAPSLHGISLCYPSEGNEVVIGDNTQLARMASEISIDPNQVKVFCARFSVKEAASSPQSLLHPPEGWEALYW